MPAAPVDDNGTVLYFEDTGAPHGASTYLTVVLLHGLLFHGGQSSGPLPTTVVLKPFTISYIPESGSLCRIKQSAARTCQPQRLPRFYQVHSAGAGCTQER